MLILIAIRPLRRARPPLGAMRNRSAVIDLALTAFVAIMLALGLRRPYLWVLTYLYIDIVQPQKISWFLLASIPISLIAFVIAFIGWLAIDDKRSVRLGLAQVLLMFLLIYCGLTTLSASFPIPAAEKWSWVWKALVFALFLPLTLRTRLRIEATVLFMTLAASAIIINGGIKTVLGGGGYGTLHLYVNDNTGLYEGSIISCVAIAIIPLILWLRKHGTIFPTDWRVNIFAAALIFACLLMPVGTAARTGLICIGVLAILSLRSVKRRFLYVALAGALGLASVPFLPKSFTDRMGTIDDHQADQSASTRVAVWMWTWKYVQDHPFGGGFDSYRGNSFRYKKLDRHTVGNTTVVEAVVVEDKARAFHSSYFEMLGEQGWPGFLVWLWLQLLGLWQMESIRRRWLNREGAGNQWQSPLANALQQAQIIYLVGSLFVGIAYQPFILMLIGLQAGLVVYLRQKDAPSRTVARIRTAMKPLKPSVAK
jgi:O-antigen ligase